MAADPLARAVLRQDAAALLLFFAKCVPSLLSQRLRRARDPPPRPSAPSTFAVDAPTVLHRRARRRASSLGAERVSADSRNARAPRPRARAPGESSARARASFPARAPTLIHAESATTSVAITARRRRRRGIIERERMAFTVARCARAPSAAATSRVARFDGRTHRVSSSARASTRAALADDDDGDDDDARAHQLVAAVSRRAGDGRRGLARARERSRSRRPRWYWVSPRFLRARTRSNLARRRARARRLSDRRTGARMGAEVCSRREKEFVRARRGERDRSGGRAHR